MGFFVAMETYVTFFWSMQFLARYIVGPNNMCIFEKNRLRIDDFRKSEKIVCFLWRHVAQKRDVNSEGRLQRRYYIRNVAQPTRSLYDFRFKSYGPLCDFYKSGDLDLDLYPIFTKKIARVLGTYISCQIFRKIGPVVACTSCNYGQTNRQTDRQTAVKGHS